MLLTQNRFPKLLRRPSNLITQICINRKEKKERFRDYTNIFRHATTCCFELVFVCVYTRKMNAGAGRVESHWKMRKREQTILATVKMYSLLYSDRHHFAIQFCNLLLNIGFSFFSSKLFPKTLPFSTSDFHALSLPLSLSQKTEWKQKREKMYAEA